jgi:hypothetical protein
MEPLWAADSQIRESASLNPFVDWGAHETSREESSTAAQSLLRGLHPCKTLSWVLGYIDSAKETIWRTL